MKRVRVWIVLAAVAALGATFGPVTDAALIKVPPLILRADGGFAPVKLPRRHYAPIQLEGHATLRSTAGVPPPLQHLVLEFDRDGLLTNKGLPTCSASKVEHATVFRARRKCKGAIVGKGTVAAQVLVSGRWVHVIAPLTLFNGPRGKSRATVVAHAQPVSLPDEIYVVTIPIERIHGAFRYRATVEVPEIFDGNGVLTGIEATIDRRYRYHGQPRSYASARCRDGILGVRGHAIFAEGFEMAGTIEKGCNPIP